LIIAASAVFAILGAGSSGAQTFGDAAAGREIAAVWCAGCHRIGAGDRDGARVPPDFGAIALMPSMTELALRVFLQTPHGSMPRYQFSPKEIDDIIAYIFSLKPR
jgi:mono/diheme cytochrome c family protein